MPPIDRIYAGAAVKTTTATVFTPTSPGVSGTYTVADDTGWPTGEQFPVKLNAGLGDEEHVLCTRSGVTFTVVQRGYDGTSAQAHAAGATVEIYFDARTANLIVDHIDGVEVNPHSGVLLNNAAHDIEARHTFGAAYGTPSTPTAITPDLAGNAGAGNNPAREDHAHATAAATAITITGANAEGVSTSFARADHDHALAANVVGSSQIAADAVGSSEIASGAIDDENLFSAGLSPIIVSATDPGAVGAGRMWLNTNAAKRALLARNAGDTAWEVIQSLVDIAYVPTYPGMFQLGNAVHYARYSRHGSKVIVNGFFRVGGTTSFAGMTNLAVSLPLNAQAKDLDSFAVGGEFFGMSGARCQIGSTSYAGVGVVSNAGPSKALDRMHFIVTAGSSSAWAQTIPGSWASGDEFEYFVEYEPATLEDASWV